VETFTPLLKKVDSELLEKTKNFLSAEKDKNQKNTSKDCKNSQTKATNNINSMATREYVTRNKAKGPYTHTSLPQTQKRQKKDTTTQEQQQQQNQIVTSHVTQTRDVIISKDTFSEKQLPVMTSSTAHTTQPQIIVAQPIPALSDNDKFDAPEG